MKGCYKEWNTPEETLEHLETGAHPGLGLGNNRQLRACDGKYYLRTYGGNESQNGYITRDMALALIRNC